MEATFTSPMDWGVESDETAVIGGFIGALEEIESGNAAGGWERRTRAGEPGEGSDGDGDAIVEGRVAARGAEAGRRNAESGGRDESF